MPSNITSFSCHLVRVKIEVLSISVYLHIIIVVLVFLAIMCFMGESFGEKIPPIFRQILAKSRDNGFVCFDALHPSQQFFSHVVIISCLTSFKQQIDCLVQGHKTATLPAMSLELATLPV